MRRRNTDQYGANYYEEAQRRASGGRRGFKGQLAFALSFILAGWWLHWYFAAPAAPCTLQKATEGVIWSLLG